MDEYRQTWYIRLDALRGLRQMSSVLDFCKMPNAGLIINLSSIHWNDPNLRQFVHCTYKRIFGGFLRRS